MKTAIKQDVILYAFEIGTCFSLYCDSNDWAVGAVLTQSDNQRVDRPIFFISQKLKATQRRWATIENEAYAIIWALNKLKEIITGSKIIIYTDLIHLHI